MKITLKKPVKVILIIFSSFIALFLLISILISPIAHWYIEKNSKKICHRTVTMDKLRINLFNGSVDIKGFKALEENDNDTFLIFNELYVNANLWKLIGKTVRLTEITLDTPNVAIIQNGKRFNFSDIIDFYKPDKKKKKEKKKSVWTIDLQNITLSSGEVVYRDAKVGSCFDLKQLAIAIPQIHFSNQKTDVGLDLEFANGGNLALKLLYSIEKNSYDLHIDLKKFDISSIHPYLQQFLNISQLKGRLSTNLNLHGNLNHILEITGNGNVNLTQFSATLSNEQPLGNIDNLQVNIENIDTKNNIYHISEVKSEGIHAQFGISENGNTYKNLLVERKKDTLSSTEPDTSRNTRNTVQLLIDKISIQNSDVEFVDQTINEPVHIPITNINLDVQHFSLSEPIQAQLKALIAETGQLNVDYGGSLQNLSNLKLNVYLSNFKLNTISPYSIHHLAYPISDGLLSFVSTTQIDNNQLDSKNKVEIYNCVVDKKLKGVKSEHNIPLRAAVFVLTDRKGKISLDLPVSGDITSPTFSYRKIIWKTFCNLIVKVAAAPIDMMAKALGVEPDIFADIEYEIHPQGLGSEYNDRLNKIADELKTRPDVILTMQQSLDMEENIREYALFDVKCAYYKSHNNITNLSIEDYENISNIKNNASDFVKFVNKQTGKNVQSDDIYDKCLSLVDTNQMEAQVKSNIERRNNMLIKHFTTQNIPMSQLEILPLGHKKTSKGKTLLSFGMKIGEE
ncbi:MAG: DUF748 domain-containing protein [Bacteroidales bacterium]|nr:DUF748 domain-containing protein [Bacteroidales bacterium]